MPDVLLLEALAQAAALLACETLGEIPGDKTMDCSDVRLMRRNGPFMKFKSRGLADVRLAVEAELLCARVILEPAGPGCASSAPRGNSRRPAEPDPLETGAAP